MQKDYMWKRSDSSTGGWGLNFIYDCVIDGMHHHKSSDMPVSLMG